MHTSPERVMEYLNLNDVATLAGPPGTGLLTKQVVSALNKNQCSPNARTRWR